MYTPHYLSSSLLSPGKRVQTLLLVSFQGHMVPMDQPAAALDMITRFMLNKNLAGDDEAVATQSNAAVATS